MPRLAPCPSCGCHIFMGSTECPHCLARFDSAGSTAGLGPMALILGLSLALPGCTTNMAMKYGPAPYDTADTLIDENGDGYQPSETIDPAQRDCDDTNAEIHPGAKETPGDSVDSNCDGADDT